MLTGPPGRPFLPSTPISPCCPGRPCNSKIDQLHSNWSNMFIIRGYDSRDLRVILYCLVVLALRALLKDQQDQGRPVGGVRKMGWEGGIARGRGRKEGMGQLSRYKTLKTAAAYSRSNQAPPSWFSLLSGGAWGSITSIEPWGTRGALHSCRTKRVNSDKQFKPALNSPAFQVVLEIHQSHQDLGYREVLDDPTTTMGCKQRTYTP